MGMGPWAEAEKTGRQRQREPGKAASQCQTSPKPLSHLADTLSHCFFPKLTQTYLSCAGRVQRQGREERVEEGGKQQGQEGGAL